MKVEQFIWSEDKHFLGDVKLGESAQLLIVFGSKNLICSNKIFSELRSLYTKAYIMGCTTSGEIYGNSVFDDTLSVTAVYFEKTKVEFSRIENGSAEESYEAGRKLALSIPTDGLRNILVLAEGININGSKLVEGLRDNLPSDVIITGGLAGDANRFEETFIIADDYAQRNMIAAAAFYGESIKVGYGTAAGWTTFGIERVATKSRGTELFEIDGKPALDLYKVYLGDYVKELPASGLLFPLHIRSRNSDYSFIRALLRINEERRSLLFGAEVPEGAYCRLMKANFTSLVNGSIQAAEKSMSTLGTKSAKLAILNSCIGRKLVLKQMTDEEVEAAREIIGRETVFTGFYTYGEISPLENGTGCELHNQTMTITLFDEE